MHLEMGSLSCTLPDVKPGDCGSWHQICVLTVLPLDELGLPFVHVKSH